MADRIFNTRNSIFTTIKFTHPMLVTQSDLGVQLFYGVTNSIHIELNFHWLVDLYILH